MVEISFAKCYNRYMITHLEENALFGCKKKKKNNNDLFGKQIEPNCAYCANSLQVQGDIRCRIGQIPEEMCCRQYIYDPLRRAPRGEPKLGNFTAEDFEL